MQSNITISDFKTLQESFAGELYFDNSITHNAQKILYSTDASVYQEKPLAVAIPRDVKDLKALIKLANEFSHIVLEDLNIKGMSKNRKLSKSILDMGFYNFRNRLGQKLALRNKQLTIANRWFASSKACSTNNCNYLYQEMSLKDRMWGNALTVE